MERTLDCAGELRLTLRCGLREVEKFIVCIKTREKRQTDTPTAGKLGSVSFGRETFVNII